MAQRMERSGTPKSPVSGAAAPEMRPKEYKWANSKTRLFLELALEQAVKGPFSLNLE
jgi:hypothetical protein